MRLTWDTVQLGQTVGYCWNAADTAPGIGFTGRVIDIKRPSSIVVERFSTDEDSRTNKSFGFYYGRNVFTTSIPNCLMLLTDEFDVGDYVGFVMSDGSLSSVYEGTVISRPGGVANYREDQYLIGDDTGKVGTTWFCSGDRLKLIEKPVEPEPTDAEDDEEEFLTFEELPTGIQAHGGSLELNAEGIAAGIELLQSLQNLEDTGVVKVSAFILVDAD